MRQFSRKTIPHAQARTVARRWQSSGSDVAAVSVRTKGYGPSRDLVKDADPRSRVVVETQLHPSDLEVQRSVLTLTMPTLSDVSVVNAPDHSKYRTSPMPASMLPPVPPTTASSAAGGDDVALRMELIEHSLEEQLATMANLILRQVEARTGTQLAEMESRQGDEARNMANAVIRSIRNEIHRGAAAGPAGKDDPPAINVEEIVRRVSKEIEAAVAARASTAEATMEALGGRIDAYFAKLQESVMAAYNNAAGIASVAEGGSPAAVSALPVSVTEDLRVALVDAVGQASQVQRESLMSVLDDLISDRQSRSDAGTSSGAAAAVDTKALEEFIEGALSTATDDIRRAVAAEVKKVGKGGRATATAVSADGSDAGPSAAAMEELSDRLDAAAIAAKRSLNTVEAVQESVTEMQAEQAKALELLVSIKGLLEEASAGPSKELQSSVHSPVDVEGPVRAAVEELKGVIGRLGATMDVGSENMDRQLAGMAQAISESVLAAIESRTKESLNSAVSSIEEQLRTMAAAQVQPAVAAAPVAVERQHAQGMQVMDGDLQAAVTAAVESVLAPKLEEMVERLQAAASAPPTPPPAEQQVALAQSISDSITAVLTERLSKETSTSSATSSEAVLDTKLATLRTELVSAVEKEMGKTHEVNLTPMYKYVDSMLTFLKDELSAQESNVGKKIDDVAAQLAANIASVSSETKEATQKISEVVKGEDLQQFVSKLEAAIATIGQSNPPAHQQQQQQQHQPAAPASPPLEAATLIPQIVEALKLTSLESANEEMTRRLTAIEGKLRTLGEEQQAAVRDRLDSMLAAAEARGEKVAASLAAVEAALQSHGATLDALSPASREKDAAATAAAAERVTALAELRESASERVVSITALLERIESTSEPGKRAELLRELRGDLATLSSLRQREEEVLNSVAAPGVLERGAEVAAAAAPMKRKLDRVASAIQRQLTESDKAQATSREELLAVFKQVSSEVKASSSDSDAALRRLVEERMDGMTALFKEQQEANTVRVISEIDRNTTKALNETTSAQLSSVVERVTTHTESQVLSKLAEAFARQTGETKTIVSETVSRNTETAAVLKTVEAVTTATAADLKKVLSAVAERERAAAPVVAAPAQVRVPWWWLLANPLLVIAALFASAYFLFACLLVAFVPPPPDPAEDLPPAEGEAASGLNATAPVAEAATSTGADGGTISSSRVGRRVVDQVL